MATFEIKGKILDSLTGSGISNCRIELWVQNSTETINLGLTAISVADGSYSLTGTVTNVPVKYTHFFLKIILGTQTLKETEPIDIDSARDKIYVLDVYVDTVAVSGNMRVFGRVSDAQGVELRDHVVKIFDKNFGGASTPELGSDTTDNGGYYLIGYTYTNTLKSRPDITVKVYDERDEVVATSPLFIFADPKLEVNLTPDATYKGVATFSTLMSKMNADGELFTSIFNPALSVASRITKIQSLTAQEIAYISNKTKLNYSLVSQVLDIVYSLCKINYYSDDNIHLLYALVTDEDYDVQALLSKKNADLSAKIQAAIDTNTLRPFTSTTINTFVSTLKTKLVDYLATATATPIADMFGTIGLADLNAKKAILETFLLQAESPDPQSFDYIAQLRLRIGNPATLTTAVVDKVEYFLVASKFTGSSIIVDKIIKGGYPTLNSFMSFDWNDLLTILDANTQYFPKQYTTSLEYATAIFNNIDFEYPEKFFIKRALMETAFPSATTKQFFTLNPDFPLFSNYVGVLFDASGINLTGFSTENIAQIKLDIQKLQGFSSISPANDRYNSVKALWAMGLNNVLSIDQYSKEEFISSFINVYVPYSGITEQEAITAEHTYNAAITQLLNSLNTFAAYSNELNSLNPRMIDVYPTFASQQSSTSLPDFSELFGGSNFCRCKTGRSIMSPAAYLADLLNFKINSGSRVYDILTRRKDIRELLLNEKNTFTQLPYIDLVNEILGNAIRGGSNVYNTTLDEQTISAIPEHLDSLRDAISEVNDITNKAWKLPFHYWLAEYREWCKNLTVPRYRLMELFPCGTPLTNHTLAAQSKEYLGLSTQQASKLLYNDQDILQNMNYYSGTTDYLKMVGHFLKSSGMALEELKLMLSSYYVNPVVSLKRIAISLAIENDIQICDLDQAEFKYSLNGSILNITTQEIESFLKRIYKYAHLYKLLKLNVAELDLLLTHEGYLQAQWNDDLLIAIAEKIRLKNDLSISLDDTVLIYGEFSALDYDDYTNLYDSLFTNIALKTFPENLTTLTLNDGKAKNLICGALQINETDYYYLLKELNLVSTSEVYQLATKVNLALIYRTNRFCKLLKISFKDYFKLVLANNSVSPVKTSSQNPTVKQTRDFIEFYTTLSKRNITIDEIYMLLSSTRIQKVKTIHSISSPSEFCITIGNKLYVEKEKLKLELGVDQNFELYKDSYEETITGFLTSIGFSEEQVSTVFGILDTPVLSVNELGVAREFIMTHFSSFCNQSHAAIGLTTGSSVELCVEEHYKYLLNDIIHFKLRPILFNELALEFDISYLQVNKIMIYWIETYVINEFLKAIEFFINNDQIEEFNPLSQTTRDFTSRKEHLDRFTKAAYFITKYKMSDMACDFIYNSFKNEADHKILNIFNLPPFDIQESEIVPHNEEISTRSTFVFDQDILLRWNNLDTAFRLDNSFSVAPRTLFTIWNSCTFEGFNQLDLMDELSRTTGWNVDHIAYLMDTIDVSLRFCTIAWIKQLAEKLFVSSILGLIPQAIVSINLPDTGITNLQVQVLRGAVKSKFASSQWIKVAKGIMDPLRRELRDAFVSYILTNGFEGNIFQSVNAIYDHFLIDPLMEPCSKTSRIVQATLSVQLYVQRILLNLEESIQISSEAKERWLWHKNYRVWEACRKIFLYPENWLEPDWRKNKSEFFIELNDYLIENDITAETAEKAFVDYIDKIQEVSDLEVVSMYKEGDKDGVKMIHFLGKTRSYPNNYYYRSYDNISEVWTNWQKIEIDIESDNITLAIWNERIYIFWPIITTTKAEYDGVSFDKFHLSGYTEEQFDTAVKVQIGYCYYADSKWSNKKVSTVHHLFNHSLFFTIKPIQSGFPEKLGLDIFNFNDQLSKIYLPFVNYDDDKMELALVINKKKYFWHNELYYDSFTNAKIQVFRNDTVKFLRENVTINDGLINAVLENPLYIHKFSHHTYGDLENGRIKLDPKPNEDIQFYHVKVAADSGLMAGSNAYVFKDFQVEGTSYQTIANSALWDFKGNEHVFNFSNTDLLPICYRNSKHAWYSIPKRTTNSTSSRLYHLINSTLNDKPASELSLVSLPKESIYVEPDKNAIVNTCCEELVVSRYTNSNANSSYEAYKYWSYPLDNWFIKNIMKYSKENLFSIFDSSYDNVNPLESGIFETDQSSLIQDLISLDFVPLLPFGNYNWELFYHIPMLIATKLSTNQQFEEAQKWFHCVFDPTRKISSPFKISDVWKFRPFQDFSDDTTDIRKFLHGVDFDPNRVTEWENDPLDAHAIVRNRYMAYMRYTVMKYLDNLIAWGDYLFAQDSLEALNEATQIYILAAEILGPKPELVEVTLPDEKSFEQIMPLDSLSNSLFTLNSSMTGTGGLEDMTAPKYVNKNRWIKPPVLTAFKSLYFGIPYNEKLIEYWDKVNDRLFKLRNCMNLKGIVRDLPLFSPPIDPALLVQASAAGLNLSQIIAGLNVSVGAYRYRSCMQKAKELTNEVIALGSSLLSALEKRDSESLSLLKATHETTIQKAIRGIKEKAVEELQNTIESLELNISNAEARFKFNKERNPLIANEKLHFTKLEQANKNQLIAQSIMPLVSALGITPQITGGLTGVQVTFGGVQLKVGPQTAADIFNIIASVHQYQAQVAAIKAGYDRRQEEWDFQANQADTEIKSLQKQLLASKIRLAIAEHELSNHDLQIEQSEEYYAFLKEKFTNKELYDWMVSDLSSIYFQSYRLANEYAKQAELTYRFEINAPMDDTFISFGHWDNLKKGLLSGERLRAELNMLDKAYTDANIRKLEITKLFSLTLFDSEALKDLRVTGSCEVNIPEFVYDLDYPGQYLRRIKSVAISIPAVTAPNSSVACKLTLLENSYRFSSKLEGGYPEGESDIRFVYNPVNLQSIVTSSAQNDRGIFEFNFNDERYLPFEGAGAISRWRIELPEEFRQFDYNTISDVILHINYTAEEDGKLKEPAVASIKTVLTQSIQEQAFKTSFNWKAVCPDSLYQLNSSSGNSANFRITANQFPSFITDYLKRSTPEVSLSIIGMEIIVPGQFTNSVSLKTLPGTQLAHGQLTAIPAGTPSSKMTFSSVNMIMDTTEIAFDLDGLDLNLEFTGGNLDDILMILAFKVD